MTAVNPKFKFFAKHKNSDRSGRLHVGREATRSTILCHTSPELASELDRTIAYIRECEPHLVSDDQAMLEAVRTYADSMKPGTERGKSVKEDRRVDNSVTCSGQPPSQADALNPMSGQFDPLLSEIVEAVMTIYRYIGENSHA